MEELNAAMTSFATLYEARRRVRKFDLPLSIESEIDICTDVLIFNGDRSAWVTSTTEFDLAPFNVQSIQFKDIKDH